MPLPGQRERGQPADASAGPARQASAQELPADVIRYRTLAQELAARRKAGGQSANSDADRFPAAGVDVPTSLRSGDGPETAGFSRGQLALGAALLFLALLGIAAWRDLDSGGLGALRAANAGGDTRQSSEGMPPETPRDGLDFAGASQLLLPLEAALIATTTETEALADIRHRLQKAESLAAEYGGLLAQERAHSRVLEEQLVAYQTAPSPPSPPGSDPASPSVAEPPSGSRSSPPLILAPQPPPAELDRLMMRASQLREQGDIAAARIVLESGAQLGHGPALFALAETYDPAVLSAWRTFGTQGDVEKARRLYKKAEAAGVGEAADRLKSLPH
jgi:hypothetical protein